MIKRVLMWVAFTGAALFIAGFAFSPFYKVNFTPSLPLGIYKVTHDPSAPDIIFCLAEADTVPVRAYMTSGYCPGRVAPLLKPVVRPTVMSFSPEGFKVDGRLIPNTAPKSRSRTGLLLQHMPYGTYYGGLWAIDSYTPDAWDSRYFGPVRDGSIISYAIPFWTF